MLADVSGRSNMMKFEAFHVVYDIDGGRSVRGYLGVSVHKVHWLSIRYGEV